VKARGPKGERETVITFNDADDIADIWAASNGTYKKLIKSGHKPTEDNERSASFRIPKKCVSLRKPKPTSEKRRQALARVRGRARGESNENGLIVQ
jgi:hypothetical protein